MLQLKYLFPDNLSPNNEIEIEPTLLLPFSGASIDSRTIKKGEIFFAIKGKNLDGHTYVEKALNAGAVLAVVVREFSLLKDKRLLYVDDPLKVFHALANKIRELYNPLTIAITGSVGKTTTKNFIGGLFSELAPTVFSKNSFNNEFGIPLTLVKINDETRYACIEIGINTIGEMEQLARTVAPDVAVITNIGTAHIGRFGSVDMILKEKSKLLDKLRSGGTAILNADDENLRSLEEGLQSRGVKTIWFGTNEKSQVQVISKEVVGTSQKLLVSTPRENIEVVISPADAGTMYACLASIAVGISADIEPSAILLGMSHANIESRLRIRSILQGRVIDDTYNASAASILNGINLLKETKENAIFVLGDLREVGDYLVDSYSQILCATKEIGGEIIVVGETSNSWWEAAKLCQFGGDKLTVVDRWDKAIKILSDKKIPSNTAVFVKGSRFSHLERVALFMEGQKSTCYKTSCSKYIHCSECSTFNL